MNNRTLMLALKNLDAITKSENGGWSK